MKKLSKGIFVLWMLIAVAAAGGAFLFAEHLGGGTPPSAGVAAAPSSSPDAQPYADIESDDTADTAAPATPIALQNFSDQDAGYAFSVPAAWSIEKTGADTVAVHADASSSAAACKIEVSAFPYSGGADGMADWITQRIGADPSIAVTEQSSGQIPLAGGVTGVEWTGTIDGLPTTLVYAFNAQHAYEIAPSVVGEDAGGDAQCAGMLQSFLSTFKI